jgi:hypothetical protein
VHGFLVLQAKRAVSGAAMAASLGRVDRPPKRRGCRRSTSPELTA